MEKNPKSPAGLFNNMTKEKFEEHKDFYKTILLQRKSLEEKMDGVWHLPDEDLTVLLEHFQTAEQYEICEAIKAVLDERK